MSKKKPRYIFENIEVIDAGAGKSVAKAPDGRVIFLENAVPGDVVDIKTVKTRKAYFVGIAIKFHKYSDKRTKPRCTHFENCGGCNWQHMKYEYQLFYKEKEVILNLERIGNLDIPNIKPIIGCEEHYFYRNKMEFSFSDNRWMTPEEINSSKKNHDKKALGLHVSGMWDKILDIKKCYLQEDPSNDIRNTIKTLAIENNIEFYNPRKKSGLLRNMILRIVSTGEIMLIIQFFKDDKEKRKLFMNSISDKFKQITSLHYIINKKVNDSIYDQDIILFSGRDHIFEKMEDLYFKINAKSFYQTNSKQTYNLYKTVRNLAKLTGEELVYDLYTGIGTIAQFISKKAKKVVGIDIIPEAIEDAKENTKYNKINNVIFFVGNIKDTLTSDFTNQHGKPDVIIANPPRNGLYKKIVSILLKISPKKIIYISCNSATQARDLSLMKEHYKVTSTQSIDMFPQTQHVENVVLLDLKI